MIDDLLFPHLRDYDLNLWIDDDNYLRVSAYQLCLSKSVKLDEDGQPTWQVDNQGCADPITLVCVHYDDYNEPDREAIFADLGDDWNTATGFLMDEAFWTKKYPDFFRFVKFAIEHDLTDEFGNFLSYEACQHG